MSSFSFLASEHIAIHNSLNAPTSTMLVSLTVGKVDAGVAVLLTEDKRLVCPLDHERFQQLLPTAQAPPCDLLANSEPKRRSSSLLSCYLPIFRPEALSISPLRVITSQNPRPRQPSINSSLPSSEPLGSTHPQPPYFAVEMPRRLRLC